MNSFKLKKWDAILIGVILIASAVIFLVFYLGLQKGQKVKITVDGKEKYSFSLNQNTVKKVVTEKGENTVEIRDGVVRVTQGDCPDKICVNHRAISKAGETIVCLPHRLVVEIEGGE